VPVFFSGINDYGIRARLDPARMTGVFERKEIAPNLRLMRRIDPAIREIVIVGDASETYRAIETEIRRELQQHTDIHATFVSSNRIDDIVARLHAQRGRFVFLTTLGSVTDRAGRTLTLPETIKAIVNAGHFVVFSMEDAYLYPGVLGGYVTSGPREGRAAAGLLIRHLNGVAVSALPPIETSPNEYIIDESELLKAGFVLPGDIATEATLVNPLPSFYESNRRIILGTLYGLIALLLLGLAASLLLFVRKTGRSRLLRASWAKPWRVSPRRSASPTWETGIGRLERTGCSGRKASIACSASRRMNSAPVTRLSLRGCIPMTARRWMPRSGAPSKVARRTRSIIASCARMARSGSCMKARKSSWTSGATLRA